MSNQELINAGMKQMDETDQAIERSKQVVHQTIEVGTQTATTLKGQTEQMGQIVNELDSIQFSIKKALQLVKEIDRQDSKSKLRIQAQLQEAMQDYEELTKEIDVFKEKLEKQRTRQEEELAQMKVQLEAQQAVVNSFIARFDNERN
ncbi:putative plant SNARE [Arachis hypogaea]|nr:putative plant SNARE [Arachis hypogaea]